MSYFRILIAALSLSLLLTAQDGPTHVIVTYRVYPEKRAPFRQNLYSYVNRLSHWKEQGTMGPFQVLVNSLVDDEAWETLIVARTGTRGLELFRRFEQPENSGIFNTTTIPADLTAAGGDADGAANAGIYLVMPYECQGGGAVEIGTRLVPLMNASLKADGLLGYRFFVPRYPGGRSWNALLVLHFADWIAAGKAEPLTAKVSSEACREKVAVLAEAIATR